MSRYFTSPPPVYARNWAYGQNLVESTKIVDTKKVHRKEKKEKRKDKKLKKERSLKKQLYFSTKQVSDESEQVEKSCLTVEAHVGYLSDGSQNSKKRSRVASPVVESQIKATTVAGNPLRIRFVFKEQKVAEVVVPQEDRLCSTSGTKRPIELLSSVPVPKTTDHNENMLSTEVFMVEIPSESKKRKKHKPSKESRYNTFIDEWVAPCISLGEDDSNCDDWLFGTRRHENTSIKAIKNNEVVMNLKSSVDSSSFRRAQFLSDVGIFSLPYTVLF
ncbi:hypothetical protein V5N11_005209 [Cardamine amara subsp. amara]|uniref:Uncharacterized protein n=1 Tax=Cardamine amara subsp. amara TaxID=228776 RepID=A0ABD1ACQ8_CARAN